MLWKELKGKYKRTLKIKYYCYQRMFLRVNKKSETNTNKKEKNNREKQKKGEKINGRSEKRVLIRKN